MTTSKRIETLIQELGKLTNTPTSRNQAEAEGKNHYITTENNPIYGGHRLIKVNLPSGSHSGIFGFSDTEPRVKAGAMVERLYILIKGIEYGKKLSENK